MVSVFGLTYDMNENARVSYPTMVTDWGSPEWFDVNTQELADSVSDVDGHYRPTLSAYMDSFPTLPKMQTMLTSHVCLDSMLEFLTVGLGTVKTPFSQTFNVRGGRNGLDRPQEHLARAKSDEHQRTRT